MNRLSIITLLIRIVVLPMLLFSTSINAMSQEEPQSIGNNQTSLNTISILYENGLIDANINDAPIGQILEELKDKTGIGVNINVNNPSIVNSRVSLTLRKIPLGKAIQIILEGFSYALYPLDDRFTVSVLPEVPETVMTHQRVTSEPKTTAQAISISKATEGFEAQSVYADNGLVPKSLDDFQSITKEEHWLEPTVEESTEYSEQIMAERRYQEALVQRAYDVINSEHEHLYEDALNQLIGINDAQATEMLIDASTTEYSPISRAQAVDALWQHATNLQFTDTTSIDALIQLSEDGDDDVRSIALQALREIEQHQDNDE